MKYQFAPLRLEVSQKGEGNVRAQLAIDESGQSTVQSSKVPYPLVLKPMLESQYLTVSLVVLLSNHLVAELFHQRRPLA